jgi:hypothetical protein
VAGDLRVSRNAAATAMKRAEAVEFYDDALLEALATDVVVRGLATARSRSPSRQRQRLQRDVPEMKRSAERCLALNPYWAERERVVADLDSLIESVKRLAEGSPQLRRRVALALAPPHDGKPDSDATFSSLEDHRTLRCYDPLRRDLDRIVLMLRTAIECAGDN